MSLRVWLLSRACSRSRCFVRSLCSYRSPSRRERARDFCLREPRARSPSAWWPFRSPCFLRSSCFPARLGVRGKGRGARLYRARRRRGDIAVFRHLFACFRLFDGRRVLFARRILHRRTRYPASIAARAALGNGKAAGTLAALALLSLAAALAFANVLPRLPFKTPALKEPRYSLGSGARSALFRHEIILNLRKGGTNALLPFVLVPLVSLSLAFLCDRTTAGLLPVPVGGLSATAASLVSVATLGGGTAIARGKECYIHAATLPVKAVTVARAAPIAAAVRSGLCSALSAAALAAAGLTSFSVAVSCFATSFAVSAASSMLACRAELRALARSGSGDGAGEGVYALSTLVFCALTVGGGYRVPHFASRRVRRAGQGGAPRRLGRGGGRREDK